jgi:hypothetical protein
MNLQIFSKFRDEKQTFQSLIMKNEFYAKFRNKNNTFTFLFFIYFYLSRHRNMILGKQRNRPNVGVVKK